MKQQAIASLLLFVSAAAHIQAADQGATRITLSGPVSASQLRCVRDSMPLLRELDMQSAILPGDSLPSWSLAGCPASAVTLPASLQHIGPYALAATSVNAISIPSSVKSIGAYAFAGSAITGIVIGPNIKSVGPYAFKDCTALVEASYQASSAVIPTGLFSGCTSLTSVGITPSVSIIDDEAFQSCAFTAIDLGNTHVSRIGHYAFAECRQLSAVILPDALTDIEAGAFLACRSLVAIALPGSLSHIGTHAMAGTCRLEEIDANAPASVPSLGEKVWRGIDCSNVDLLVPENLRHDYSTTLQWRDFHIPNPTGSDHPVLYDSTLKITQASNILEIHSGSSAISSITIFAANGQIVYSASLNADKHVIDTERWSHNVYIITAILADGKKAAAKVAL